MPTAEKGSPLSGTKVEGREKKTRCHVDCPKETRGARPESTEMHPYGLKVRKGQPTVAFERAGTDGRPDKGCCIQNEGRHNGLPLWVKNGVPNRQRNGRTQGFKEKRTRDKR